MIHPYFCHKLSLLYKNMIIDERKKTQGVTNKTMINM